jgi:hypothetical protein
MFPYAIQQNLGSGIPNLPAAAPGGQPNASAPGNAQSSDYLTQLWKLLQSLYGNQWGAPPGGGSTSGGLYGINPGGAQFTDQ